MLVLDHFKVIVSGIPLFCLAFFLLLLSKTVYEWTVDFSVEGALVKEDNPAFGLHFFGYLVGVSLALLGSLNQLTGHLATDLGTLLLGGLVAIVLLRASIKINDTFILSDFSLYKEMLQDRNSGAGAVVAGSSLASGLIINGILSGDSPDRGSALTATIVFFIAGQVMLIIAAKVLQKITPYNMSKILEEEDSLAVGIQYGSFLLAIGIILRSSLAGASRGLSVELLVLLVFGLVGLLLLFASQVIAERLFLSSSDMMDEISRQHNPAAALVAAACYLSIACFISALV